MIHEKNLPNSYIQQSSTTYIGAQTTIEVQKHDASASVESWYFENIRTILSININIIFLLLREVLEVTLGLVC